MTNKRAPSEVMIGLADRARRFDRQLAKDVLQGGIDSAEWYLSAARQMSLGAFMLGLSAGVCLSIIVGYLLGAP